MGSFQSGMPLEPVLRVRRRGNPLDKRIPTVRRNFLNYVVDPTVFPENFQPPPARKIVQRRGGYTRSSQASRRYVANSLHQIISAVVYGRPRWAQASGIPAAGFRMGFGFSKYKSVRAPFFPFLRDLVSETPPLSRKAAFARRHGNRILVVRTSARFTLERHCHGFGA